MSDTIKTTIDLNDPQSWTIEIIEHDVPDNFRRKGNKPNKKARRDARARKEQGDPNDARLWTLAGLK